MVSDLRRERTLSVVLKPAPRHAAGSSLSSQGIEGKNGRHLPPRPKRSRSVAATNKKCIPRVRRVRLPYALGGRLSRLRFRFALVTLHAKLPGVEFAPHYQSRCAGWALLLPHAGLVWGTAVDYSAGLRLSNGATRLDRTCGNNDRADFGYSMSRRSLACRNLRCRISSPAAALATHKN